MKSEQNEWIKCNKLNALQSQEIIALKAHIKRLEEAGTELRECASWVGHACCQYVDQIRRAKAAIETWDKEDKL
jgi:hypothetical protein